MDDHVYFLAGPRVYLRPLEESELPLFVRWMNTPEVRRYLLFNRPIDMVAEKEWFQRQDRSQTPSDVVLGIALRDDHRLIGSCGVHSISWINRVGEIGILIGMKDEWGQGYARDALRLLIGYAFDTLDLARIESRVLAPNTRSANLMLRLGFREEGHLRARHYREGQRMDEIYFGMMRDEFKATDDPAAK